jgi:hypothetical protein
VRLEANSKPRTAVEAALFEGLCRVGGLLDGCSLPRGVKKPHSESCHQRHNNHHAEQ